MPIYKKYSELAEGDKILYRGYKGTVSGIRVVGVCENDWYRGERIYRFRIDFDPSPDHIERTIYNGAEYGGVESLEVAIREDGR